MHILNCPELISGGTSSALPTEVDTSTSAAFDKSIVGYVKTLVGWELIDHSYLSAGSDAYTYRAIYDISPLYK